MLKQDVESISLHACHFPGKEMRQLQHPQFYFEFAWLMEHLLEFQWVTAKSWFIFPGTFPKHSGNVCSLVLDSMLHRAYDCPLQIWRRAERGGQWVRDTTHTYPIKVMTLHMTRVTQYVCLCVTHAVV